MGNLIDPDCCRCDGEESCELKVDRKEEDKLYGMSSIVAMMGVNNLTYLVDSVDLG